MRFDRRAVMALACAVAGIGVVSTAQQSTPPTFRSGVRLVRATFAPGDYQLLAEVHRRKGLPANASRQMPFTVLESEAAAGTGGATP